ncbi:GntR family transcriptional regulator [Planctomonas deserti]|uniref:GntR family transcriptional regulator n=1 Tax=Planctomonas deserti TaxID=2144185 RepID=UPI000D395814|nr:GntR family transcriptional regulator [Planctomonas deserti]
MPDESTLPADLFSDMDRAGPIPLYHQVATRIESAILNGSLPAGARLENEIALSQRLGLSRPTIRRAIQDVVDKGLLVRRRGVGTQVVHGQLSRKVELTSLYEDLARSNKQPSTKLLTHQVVGADERMAEILDVPLESPVLHVRRLRYADGVPIGVLENFLPETFTTITAAELETSGLYQVLRARNVTIRVAHQKIGARTATAEEGRLLEIGHGAVLTMDRTAFDNSGRAVEFGHHCYRPDLYSFEVTLVDK